MYLLDTNVLYEITKKSPNPSVVNWISQTNEELFFLSVFVVGELIKGVHKLKDLAKKEVLQQWLQNELQNRFNHRILSFTKADALFWGEMHGSLEQRGINISVIDTMIASIAISNNLTLVTRNTKDFEPTGVRLLNPWIA